VHRDWIVPGWAAPASVRAICTTRQGGISLPPYDSLNLGDHVGDGAAAVAHNRRVLKAALGARPIFLQQVHGSAVEPLDAQTPDGTQADGCVSTQAGVACTIMVADCLPVLLTDSAGTAVAAAHAGWRGLAGPDGIGVIENVVYSLWKAMQATPAAAAGKTIAWLGPCIGPKAFEVGEEVRQVFIAQQPTAAAMFKPHAQGKWLADLQGLARLRLSAMGITQVHGNDGSAAWCTVGNASRFFSHRRDRVSGRFAACIWLHG
jgi:polyphenol oxidase